MAEKVKYPGGFILIGNTPMHCVRVYRSLFNEIGMMIIGSKHRELPAMLKDASIQSLRLKRPITRPKSNYVAEFITIKKEDIHKLIPILQQLEANMVLLKYDDYESECNRWFIDYGTYAYPDEFDEFITEPINGIENAFLAALK